jgi:hypothetical protein
MALRNTGVKTNRTLVNRCATLNGFLISTNGVTNETLFFRKGLYIITVRA